ncbi:MAG: hypothetical protein Q9170_005383 [Blastenia crenularia]
MSNSKGNSTDDHILGTSSRSYHSDPDPPIATSALDFKCEVSSSPVEAWLDDVCQAPSPSPVQCLSQASKRKLSTSECESHIRIPLKRQNLHDYLASMDSGSTSQAQHKDANTPSDSKTKSTSNSAHTVRAMAAQHRIYRDHENWYLYPDFQKHVRRPLEEGRHYSVRPVSEEVFLQRWAYYGDGNEESYKHELLKSIIKDEFSVKLSSDGDGDVFGPCTLLLEGVVAKYSARLRQGYLPHRYTSPEYTTPNPKPLKKELQAEGMTTPEPDGIWGFNPEKMPKGYLRQSTFKLMTLCPKLHWPFLSSQCKLDADYDESLNQNSRDGAAIGNASLHTLRHAGYKRIAQFWVHWTELDAAGVRNFHMNSIAPIINIEGRETLSILRDKAQAIVEWGLNTRMPEVAAYYPAIYSADKKAQNKALGNSSLLVRTSATPAWPMIIRHCHLCLLFRHNVDWKNHGNLKFLNASSRVALGPTDVCCREGIGKLLIVPMLMKISENMTNAGGRSAHSATANAIRGFYRLPRLVYVPYRWSKRDKRHWATMDHDARFQPLNARAGALMLKGLIMPINLVVQREFQLDAFVDDDSGCKALLAIEPRALVGWSQQFQQKAKAVRLAKTQMDTAHGAWYEVDKAALTEYRAEDAEEVIAKPKAIIMRENRDP